MNTVQCGWVKLHRKMINWEWYSDIDVFRVFSHLLLTANHTKRNWQGITLDPGQLVTGRKKMASELNLSESTIRTVLSKLKSTKEIVIKTTNKYSIITICKWDIYQSPAEEERPSKRPLKRQTNAQQVTTDKERKERKEEKNNIPDEFSEFWKKYPGTKSAIQIEYEKFSKKNKPETLLLLLPGLEKELKHHEQLKSQKSFVPSWKNLTNWIKDRCWEQVWPEPQNPNNQAQKVEIEQKQANSEEPYFVKINRERLKK